MTSQRAAPQYCPYCGDEDLVPWGELTEHAQWKCEACLRVFELRYKGLTGRDTGSPGPDAPV